MSVIEEPTPTMAQEDANSTTTLALAPEPEQLSTTIGLEKRRLALEQWEQRRDLHAADTKTHKALTEKCLALRQKYEVEVGAHRGRQLLLPKSRAESSLKRKATVKAKHAAMVNDIVDKVVNAIGADAAGKKRAIQAVADLLEPTEEKPKKRSKIARVEAEDSE